MNTGKRVNSRALRVLTYTILFKAVTDAAMLVSRITSASVIYTIAQAVGYINIVACVLCLVGVITLSKKFVSVLRIMVGVLILECVTLLMIMLEIRMVISDYITAAAVVEYIALFSYAAERLLTGAAFLFLMTGFSGILREEGDTVSAAAAEKLGVIYLSCNSAGAILSAFDDVVGSSPIIIAAVIFETLGVILEILMYRRVADAAFRIWRTNAFSDSDRGIVIS